MVKKSRSQVVPTILTLALVACEGSIMGVADPEVEFEAVASVAAVHENPPEDLVGGNDVEPRSTVDGFRNFSVLDTNNPFDTAGLVTTWEVWTRDIIDIVSVQLVIYRKTDGTDHEFSVVGMSAEETAVVGFKQFTTAPIQVLAGDFVGLVNNSVEFDFSGGNSCVLGDFTRTILFSGDKTGLTTNFEGSCNRTYSVRATGILNEPPVANAGGPYTGLEGSPVAFDGSGSSDPDGDALTFDWDFGDPSPGSGPTPSHTYLDDGAFNVTLTVTDHPGATDADATTVVITNVSPTVGPITVQLESVSVGTEVTVSAGFTDPGTLDTHTGEIDWDDGSVLPATITETGGSDSVSGKHTYTTPGVYTLQVSVTDNDGGIGTSMTVLNQSPVANAGGPYTGLEGSPVAFDGSGSSDPDGDALTFDWDFGDPSPGSGPTPSHTYGDDGMFDVILTVTDPAGATNADATTVAIANVSPTVGMITGLLEPVLLGTEVTVSAGFYDPGTLDTHTGEIDWDDGSITETGGSSPVSGTHTYTTPGVYTLQVSVTDDDGGLGTSTFEFVMAGIDIKPRSDPNCFNSNGHGVIPVAILGTVDFDVAEVDPTTVKLDRLSVEERGRRNKLMAHFDDVSGPNGIPDGFVDLVLQFKDDGTFTSESSTATLTGYLQDRTHIVGSDDICIVPLDERRRFRSKRDDRDEDDEREDDERDDDDDEDDDDEDDERRKRRRRR